jgi:hypothetical protein
MKTKIFILSIAIGIFACVPAIAADVVMPSGQDANTNIGSGETHRNLYTVGGNLSVNGTTQGDLTAAGGMVTVAGRVEQEALIAGGNISMGGPVGGTARIAGGNVSVNGPVGGDLVVVGGNVNVTGGAAVSGDLLAGTGNLILDAPVGGTVRIGGGSVTINSKIGGDVFVMAGRQLVFGPQADVGGTVHYSGTQEAVVQPGANVKNIQFTLLQKPAVNKNALAGFFAAAAIIKFIALLIAAFILAGVLKSGTSWVAGEAFRRPWSNLGVGFLAVIAAPAAIIILFATVVGFLAALILGAAYALAMLLVSVFASIAIGYLVLKWFSVPLERAKPWQAVLIGVVLWSLLGLIPFIGWLADAAVFLMVFGALIRIVPKWRMGRG